MKKIILFFAVLSTGVLSAQDYSTLIKSYLTNNRSTLQFQQGDVEDMKVSSQSFSKSMDLDNVYVTQLHEGIEIANTSSSFAIKNGTVINATLSFENNLKGKITVTAPAYGAAAAVSKAATALGMQAAQGLELLETINENSFVFNNAGISRQEIPVRLIYHKRDNALILSWEVGIYTQDGSHYYLAVLNAVTGELIHQADLVISCNFGNTTHQHTANEAELSSVLFPAQDTSTTMMVDGSQYRVFALPAESPIHGAPSLVMEPADPIASPFGWHDTDGATGPEFTITRGNNVYAQDDLDGVATFGEAPDGGSTLDFDFPQNTETTPRNNLDGAIVNLFYMNNVMHDIWYRYGFDESSGNFQENNYDNGGSGSDSVIADAQDGAGLDNASFFPPADGQNGGMNMFLWTAPPGISTPLVILDGSVADDYQGVAARFGANLPLEADAPIAGELKLVLDDDSGESTDPNDACDTILNSGDLTGAIAVLRRGVCQFGFKVLAAENAGAIAVVLVNNENTAPFAMSPGDVGGSVTIPSIMVGQSDGEAIIAALAAGETLNAELKEDPPFQKDGSLDNGVIAHEYGHGISTRLTGGRFNPGCLGNLEQMGEGWSDWFALMITIQEGQDGTDARGIGTYVKNQSTSGPGIRPTRYSTEFSVNPSTYNTITNYSNTESPHRTGYVWATMLWDLSWAFIDQYGYDDDLYNGTGGNNIVMQLVIDGLKLQGCFPGFVDGRDAILMADEIANNGENRCLIWETFARRGLGVDADQGSVDDRTDGTASFDVPAGPNCTLSANNDFDLKTNFSIYPNPSDGNINITTLVDAGDVTVSIFDINGRKVFTQEVTLQNTVAINAGSLRAGVYVVSINGDSYTHTAKIIIE